MKWSASLSPSGKPLRGVWQQTSQINGHQLQDSAYCLLLNYAPLKSGAFLCEPMNRNTALELLKTYLKTDTLIKHSLATEAIMRELAGLLGRDL